MILHLGLALFVFTGAATSFGQDEASEEEELAQFELLKQRRLERLGIPQSAAVAAPANGVPAVVVPSTPQPSFAERERERATEFNKQFGEGAYEGITGFSDRCKSADGCNKLATANLIRGAYQFVNLQKDVEDKVIAPESDAYRGRHGEIKGGIRDTMRHFRPQAGASSGYARDFIKFSDPIVKKIFTPEELLRYAEGNAASSDSAPFYTYLGKALNGAGPPGKAVAAFDAALQRDPGSDEALSGRAEARLSQGDYPGAVRDAVAALKINPRNDRAYATLRFSEGRVPAGTADWSPPGGHAAAVAAAAPGPGASMGGSPGSVAAGASFDAVRRSVSLVADARRSLGLGDPGAAIRLLSKAVELNPSSAEALALTAMAQIRLKQYPEALASAAAGLKLAPGNGLLLNAKANALNSMKDYREALASADLAIAADPDDAMAHYNRAWALGGLKDHEGALASLRAAAKLNPQFAPALEAALSLPSMSDIIYMFPGEKAEGLTAPPEGSSRPGPPPSLLLGGSAAAIAAVLMMVALLKRRAA